MNIQGCIPSALTYPPRVINPNGLTNRTDCLARCVTVCLPDEISFRIDGISPSSSFLLHLQYKWRISSSACQAPPSAPPSFSLSSRLHRGLHRRTVCFTHRHVYFEEKAYRVIDNPATDQSGQASGSGFRFLPR